VGSFVPLYTRLINLIIPCTSDTFSEYCIGLISQMLPQFIEPDFNSFLPFRLWRPLQRFELTWVYFCVRIF